jgi:hypothetical protein
MQRSKFSVISLLIVVLSGCSGGESSSDRSTEDSAITPPSNLRTFVVEQAAPSLVHIDIGQESGSHGDVLAFDAEITSNNGMSGKLSGMVTTVDIVESDKVVQDRITEIVFDFPDFGTLVVGGKSVYPFDGSGTEEMTLNNPQIRPVLGGTGGFLGAQGQVETIRNENSTYSHMFELVGVVTWQYGDSEEQRTFTLSQGVPNIVHIDLGQEGGSHGDLSAYDAEFTSDKDLSGKISGMITTVDVPEPNEVIFQDRFVKAVFDFGQGSTLVMFGNSSYPADSSGADELAINAPVKKPIVGGTGEFSGARGQVETTRNDDGTYTQTFQLVGTANPNPPTEDFQSTLTLHQTLPFLVHVDVGSEGGSHGDVLAFDAELTSTEGLLGKLSGLVITVDIPEPGGIVYKDRIVHLVFDLGSANTVVVGGKSVYPFDGSSASEFEKNIPQIRAIIGGTGDYMAARGQVVSTRLDDGSYEHVLQFQTPRKFLYPLL